MYGLCFCGLGLSGIGPLQHIPIFVYGSLLSDVGFTFMDAHLIKPMKIYGRLKSRVEDRMVLIIVVVVFCAVGMLAGLAVGANCTTRCYSATCLGDCMHNCTLEGEADATTLDNDS